MARKKLSPKVMRMDPPTNNEVFSRECVNLGSLIARSKLENREWVYPVPSSELLNCGLSCIAKSTPVNKGTTQKKAQNKRNGLVKKRKEPELFHKCPAPLFGIKIRRQKSIKAVRLEVHRQTHPALPDAFLQSYLRESEYRTSQRKRNFPSLEKLPEDDWDLL